MENSEPKAENAYREFDAPAPVELTVNIDSGAVDVKLEQTDKVTVTVAPGPAPAGGIGAGIAGIVNWVSTQFGNQSTPPRSQDELLRDAIRLTRVEQHGRNIAVQTPKNLPLRTIGLQITVTAPEGSTVLVHGKLAAIDVTGPAERATLNTATGDITLDKVAHTSILSTGSGSVRVTGSQDGLKIRTGTGDVEVGSLAGHTSIGTGGGNVWLGSVNGVVKARSGTGALTIADAAGGVIDVGTGSGSVQVGIREGVLANLDLNSAWGTARSELDISETAPVNPPAGAPTVIVKARTGAGNVLVARATTE
ncbi:hypothetical protein D5S17_01490 [Pseudonocardiaceae bacterium YIM PH 21723]|nr:hypothetical protein D5S17_01490 [Pseudonocardiaceae bacterium YIM PH 21723]